MGVLYGWKRFSECHMNHDDVLGVDDQSCVPFATEPRSAHSSRAKSSVYHSLLLVLCRVGHIYYATRPKSLPHTGDQLNSVERTEKAEHESSGLATLSATTTVREGLVSRTPGTRKRKNTLTVSIYKSRLDSREQPLGSLAPEDAADMDRKPHSTLEIPDSNQAETVHQAKPLEETVGSPIVRARQGKLETSFCSFEDNVDPADVPLPPSPSSMLLVNRSNGRKLDLASTAGYSNKRQRDDFDIDLQQISVPSKKVMPRKQKTTVSERRDYQWLPALLAESSHFPLPPLPSVEISRALPNGDSSHVSPAQLLLAATLEPLSDEPDNRTDSFISALQKFDELIGSCDASARFAENAGQCLANNKKGSRCGSRHGMRNEDRAIVETLFAELEGLNFESSPSSCIDKLRALTAIVVCHHQRKDIRMKVDGLLQRWRLENSTDQCLLKYLPLFSPYRPQSWAHLSVDECIVKKATKPFKASTVVGKELGEGYLYVYWNEATFGVRKIGFTSGNVGDRLKKWEKDCRHVAIEQYRSPCKVRHAERVEKLVHAELSDFRVFEPVCRSCSKSHKEWFKGVDLPFIVKKIEAWSQWISEEPYEKVDNQWCLTEKGKDSIPTAMVRKSCRDPETSASRPAKVSPRYNLRHRTGRKPSS